ncbi:MAG: GNAT family N-acetyltransferase [Robiginitomaculum sp.]|nr:MAG: GNAT family N-acetyltransferase [Robiginitomaculum sp.]
MYWGYKVQLRLDDLNGPEFQTLLQTHLDDAYKNSPADSVYALDIKALQHPDIAFWSVWDGEVLLGCGALKELDKTHGEIKSMRTTAEAVRRGVASKIVAHIIDQAKARGYQRLSLETGSNDAYIPARALYAKFGFKPCGPFAQYTPDSFSALMTLAL